MSNFLAVGNNEPTPDNLPDEIKKIINDGKKKAGFNPDGTPISDPTDTNQASEVEQAMQHICQQTGEHYYASETIPGGLIHWIRICMTCGHKDNKDLNEQVKTLIRTEKLKLLAELDKSMPTAEQLTTKYGYHMPDKQYGYKLALHDIREVLAKMEAEL